MPDAECRMLDAGCGILDAGYWMCGFGEEREWVKKHRTRNTE
jgi:hypothetical protein